MGAVCFSALEAENEQMRWNDGKQIVRFDYFSKSYLFLITINTNINV